MEPQGISNAMTQTDGIFYPFGSSHGYTDVARTRTHVRPRFYSPTPHTTQTGPLQRTKADKLLAEILAAAQRELAGDQAAAPLRLRPPHPWIPRRRRLEPCTALLRRSEQKKVWESTTSMATEACSRPTRSLAPIPVRPAPFHAAAALSRSPPRARPCSPSSCAAPFVAAAGARLVRRRGCGHVRRPWRRPLARRRGTAPVAAGAAAGAAPFAAGAAPFAAGAARSAPRAREEGEGVSGEPSAGRPATPTRASPTSLTWPLAPAPPACSRPCCADGAQGTRPRRRSPSWSGASGRIGAAGAAAVAQQGRRLARAPWPPCSCPATTSPRACRSCYARADAVGDKFSFRLGDVCGAELLELECGAARGT
nr:uncharacterized protein LOC127346613 [Lolium perenne]